GGFMLALQTGAVIIPVGIQGSENILRPDAFEFHLGQKVKVNIGKPIDASRYSMDDRDRLMDDVRSAILSLSGEK
ncbi:MAG TPA: 1-acyl-sn-glycerol-3-phosphate acyltransferase, partial [Desulfomonilia bacterium]|nr:1-acyl-sn-glycerol-3-phosphate acyltransferase [Desulfomonilia bacterium]